MDGPSVLKRGLSQDVLWFRFRRTLQLAVSAFVDKAGDSSVVG